MMKHITQSLFLCLLMMLVYGCSTVRVVNTEKEDNFSLQQYQTYGFYNIEPDGDTVLHEMEGYYANIDILKQEVARQLEKRGLTQSSQPQLLVNIGSVVEEKVQTRQTDFREAPIYMGQRRYTWKSKEVEVNRYKLGTVTVHLVDRATNKLVWRGVVEGVVPKDQEKFRKRVAEGMEKLFGIIPTTV